MTGKLQSLSKPRKELLNIPREPIIWIVKREELIFQTTSVMILLDYMLLIY